MAVGYVTPSGGDAQDLDTLATALAGETNISDATPIRDVPEVFEGRAAVKVTGTAEADINNAISAVGDCVLLPGTEISS